MRHGRLVVREARGMRAPSSAVFEWVRELLEETATSLAELDCIAFGAGPGSFTGVRVAVALAQGLGYARRLPLCPVSTLAALASGALKESTADMAACCLDARMGEVYFGVYERDTLDGVRAVGVDALLKPSSACLPAQGTVYAAGPGWSAHPDMTERLRSRLVAVDPERLPSAGEVACLAMPRFRTGRVVSAAEALPNYLRDRVTAAP